MDTAQRGANGRGGLKAKYVSGVLTFVNGLTGATVYTINPSTKAVAFSGAVAVTGAASFASTVTMSNLPTSNPSVAGQLWANVGVVTVSAG